MKLLFDILPLIIFFGTYYKFGIYSATWATIITTIILLPILKIMKKPIEKIHWVGLLILIVFGGLTLYLHNPLFIKLKPTILYWSFASILAVGLFLKKNFIKSILGEDTIKITEADWKRLAWNWVLFFTILGGANLAIAQSFDEATWVKFKVFGTLAATFLFVLAQSVWLSKKIP